MERRRSEADMRRRRNLETEGGREVMVEARSGLRDIGTKEREGW